MTIQYPLSQSRREGEKHYQRSAAVLVKSTAMRTGIPGAQGLGIPEATLKWFIVWQMLPLSKVHCMRSAGSFLSWTERLQRRVEKDIGGGGRSASAYNLILWTHLMSFNFLLFESYLEELFNLRWLLIIALGLLYSPINTHCTILHLYGK